MDQVMVTDQHIIPDTFYALSDHQWFDVMKTIYVCLWHRDPITAVHSHSMGKIAYELSLILDQDQAPLYYFGGIAHDIGKIGLRDSLLKGKHRFSLEEREEMKKHVQFGADILKSLQLPQVVIDIEMYHHEAFDGSGYLYGLEGREIPLAGRIATIADVFSAIITDRHYRPAKSIQDAILLMDSEKHKFDPEIYDVFLDLLDNARIGEWLEK